MILLHLLTQLRCIIPIDSNLAEAYSHGSEEDCLFVARLALFLSTFLRSYSKLLEKSGHAELQSAVVEALTYLVMVSEVDDEEIFKTCLEFWHGFTKDLFTGEGNERSAIAIASLIDGNNNNNGPMFSNAMSGSVRYDGLYATILHRLRNVMIDKMAKPEEVIIVEDDDGHIVREMTKDTEVIAQYKTMREAIVFLTHLNYDDTEAIMLQKLELQVIGGRFTWQGLNTLCWAIGSISGAMSELDEKRFLVTVIKDLLRLCEEQRGKDNKAVVASNIMYIVGQYPRFLRAHWKFLKTVVNKLFEFMHELHPGVQDMACDTFLKIAQKCKRKFMTLQTEEIQPFILTLIGDLYRHIHDLQPHQVESFYESVACMLSDQGQAIIIQRSEVIIRLMELPNTSWNMIINEGKQNIETLFQMETVKELSKVLRINKRVCSAAGSIFIHQLSNIYMDMLHIYRIYSDKIIEICRISGEVASRYTNVKILRTAKSEILELITSFIEVSIDLDQGSYIIMNTFMPPLLEEVLRDYKITVPSARDSKVLILFATAVSILKQQMSSEVPKIMEAVFEATLEMITKNMMDYPDHRIAFFKFLREANEHCFFGLFSIPSHLQKLVVDSVVWAFKHTERNISETGLEILHELLINVGRTPNVTQPFYQQFFLPLLQDIFAIMTDRLHKSSFKLQALLLSFMFQLLQRNQITIPLVDTASGMSAIVYPDGTADNQTFVKEYVAALLNNAFPNLTKSQVIAFTVGLFEQSIELQGFKQHLRDFLITVKEFQTEDNSELYNEEMEASLELERSRILEYKRSVPGLLSQSELQMYGVTDDDLEH
jgi:exportin-1